MPFTDAGVHDPLSATARTHLARRIAVLRGLPGFRPDLRSYVEQVAVAAALLASGTTETGDRIAVHDLRHADVRDDVAWGARAIADACPGGGLDVSAVADLPELLQIVVVTDVISQLEAGPRDVRSWAAIVNLASSCLTDVVLDMSPPWGPSLARQIQRLADPDRAVAPIPRRAARAA